MRYGNEIKVGIVFLLGLFVIVFGYFYLRGVGLGADKYYVRLVGAAQIAQGNDVRLRGVKIGQVAEVGFDPKTQDPILTLEVRRSNPPFQLLQSYAYTVQNSGLIGENYIDIRGQYRPRQLQYLPNLRDQIIPCRAVGGLFSAASSEDTARQLTRTLNNFNHTLELLNKGALSGKTQEKLAATLDGVARLTNNASKSFGPQGFKFGLGNPQSARSLDTTLQNAQRASAEAAVAAHNIEVGTRGIGGLTNGLSNGTQQIIGDVRGNIDSLFRDNRAQFRSLVGNLDKTSNNIAGLTETLNFTFKAGGFKENAQASFTNLRRASENIERASEGIAGLAADPNTGKSLTGALTALRESAEALRDTATGLKGALNDTPDGKTRGIFSSLNASAANLEKVSGSLAGIVGDPSLQANLKGSVENLNGTLAATRTATERLSGLLGGRKSKSVTPATPTPGATNIPRATGTEFDTTGINFTARRLLRKGVYPHNARTLGDLDFETNLFNAPFRLGLDGIGETNSFTLQSGQFFGKGAALRYGVYRSKLGAGLEVRRGRFSIEGNAYDPNHASYNLYGGYKLTPNLQLRAGAETFGGRSTGSIGFRLSQ